MSTPRDADRTGASPDMGAGAASGDGRTELIRAERIGPYRILEELGSGGFGVVYLGEQLEPVRRRVAIKIIKPGMDSKSVVHRFEAERQALALMDHANVARVFDAGTTDRGLPYFVMEYVPGVPITEHADEHRLTIRQRLDLFIQACLAVQHAHQKGIIHRDLKPTNILVALKEDGPVLKVIDFGVAKALSQPLTEHTIHTFQGQLIGTPEYMSPEQADPTAQDIDTRSDVYSLGVLLYQLITGFLPLDFTMLRAEGIAIIQREIRVSHPTKPSTRIRQMLSMEDNRSGAIEAARGPVRIRYAADQRGIEPRALARTLAGDLDWITMKCLEKDRSRRYESVGALIEDLRNHLANRPVNAGPPTVSYRLRKFAERHRTGVIVTGAIIAIVLLGMVVINHERMKASASEQRARQGLIESERQRQRALASLGFLQSILMSEAERGRSGNDVTLRERLDEASRTIKDTLDDQPDVEATVRIVLARAYLTMGELNLAEQHAAAALRIREALAADRGASNRQNLAGEIDAQREQLDLALSIYWLARIVKERAAYDEAAALYERTLEIQRSHPGVPDHDLLATLNDLGVVRKRQGRLDEAEMLFRESLQLTSAPTPERATVMTQLAEVLTERGELAEAEALCREALKIFRETYGPGDARSIRGMKQLAMLLRQSDRAEEAATIMEEGVTLLRQAFDDNPPRLAANLVGLAIILKELGQLDRAEALLNEALAIYRQGDYGPDHSYTISTELALAAVIDEAGRHESAREMLEALLARAIRAQGPEALLVNAIRRAYGACLTALGRFDQAERELLSAHEAFAASGHAERASEVAGNLVELYNAWNRTDEAAKWRAIVGNPAPRLD